MANYSIAESAKKQLAVYIASAKNKISQMEALLDDQDTSFVLGWLRTGLCVKMEADKPIVTNIAYASVFFNEKEAKKYVGKNGIRNGAEEKVGLFERQDMLKHCIQMVKENINFMQSI